MALACVDMSETKDLQIGVFIPIGNNGTHSNPIVHKYMIPNPPNSFIPFMFEMSFSVKGIYTDLNLQAG